MNKKKPLVLMLIGMMFGCSIFPCGRTQQENAMQITQPTSAAECPSLPPTFRESDLIGVWEASYTGGNDTDMLIIREDGTYKQIYDAPLADLHYESDWQEWWIEHRESGYLRLHMKGMRRCDHLISTCTREGGGLDPEEYTAIDYCENQVVEMPDGVVLIVTGVSESQQSITPRGITLRQTRVAGSEWTWSFLLKDDMEEP